MNKGRKESLARQFFVTVAFAALCVCSDDSAARQKQAQVPELARVDGKYSDLIQIVHCPADKATNGTFKDWGYWDAGPKKRWCGQDVQPGFWVYVYPDWYVWKTLGAPTPPAASPGGGATGTGSADAGSRLKQLKALHDQGLITDDEYARKRKEIIDSM